MTVADDTRATRQASLGWMIQRLARRLDDAMTLRLAELDLTVAQFGVLMMVLENGPLTQSDIGRHYAMPAYAISRALDHLQDLGLITRQAHPTSRRAHQIKTTTQGARLAPGLHRIVREVNAELLAPLTPDEADQLLPMMARLVAGYDRA